MAESMLMTGMVVIYETPTGRMIALHPKFPAYNELRSLLIALNDRFSPLVTRGWTRIPCPEPVIDADWAGQIDKVSVFPSAIEALIILSRQPIDASSLARLFPENVMLSARRALNMFARQGVLNKYSAGNAHMFALNSPLTVSSSLSLN